MAAVMTKTTFLRTAMLCMALAVQSIPQTASAGPKTIVGSWTGTAAQNVGKSNYTVVMTITSTGAETNYPELNCGGKLKRVGSANGYAFFLETITHGGKSSGGSCINGAVTVTLDGANLVWGWVGSDGGQVYVAWSNLVRK